MPRGASIDERLREWDDKGKPAAGARLLVAQVNAELRTGKRADLLPLRSVLFETACRRANAHELRELGAMIPDLAVGAEESAKASDAFKECVAAHAGAVFRHEVSKLIARPARLKLPEPRAAPPPELAIAPKTLRDSWLARAAAMEAYEQLKDAVLNDPAATMKTPVARPDIATLKQLGSAPPPELWRELLRQSHREEQEPVEGNWTVSRRALHFGIVVSLLADGKIDAAVGAVCSRLFAEEGYSDDPARQTYAAVTRDFLTAQGLDWELIFTGLLLHEHPLKPAEERAALANTESWLMLAAAGSPRGVQAGLDWINFAKMGTENARPFLLRALGPDPEPSKVLIDQRPKRLKALPPEIRGQAITALTSFLDPALPLTPLNRGLEDVTVWLAKDLEEPLKKLLGHRNRLIAARALWLLKSAGLVPPDTEIAPGPPPIRVRVMLDGAPLVNTAVTVQAHGSSQNITTNSDGELAISLEAMREPETIRSLQLSARPNHRIAVAPRAANTIEKLPPSVSNEAEPAQPVNAGESAVKPWFRVVVPVDPGDRSLKEVAIQTGELEVGLKGCPGIPDDTPVTVSLMRDEMFPSSTMRIRAKPWQSVVFQGVQVGKYRLLVQGTGLAQPQWMETHVTRRGSLKLVALAPGRTVQATLAGAPPNLRITALGKLTRDGKEVNAQLYARGDRWEGLPLGKYRLRIPSTKELEAAAQQRVVLRFSTLQSPRHAGFEMDFELTDNSPATVELGVIKLEPEK